MLSSNEQAELAALVEQRDWEAVVELTEDLEDVERPLDALEVLLAAGEHGHAGAAHNLGLAYWSTEDLPSARRWFSEAVQRGYEPSLMNLGRVCEEMGDWPSAHAAYRMAADAGQVEGLVNMGLLLLEDGDLAAAEAVLRRAASQDARFRWQAAGRCARGSGADERGGL